MELAEASLSYLTEQVNAGNTEVEIYNPGNPWFIIGWPFDGKIPRSCSNLGWRNCLCICKRPWYPYIVSPQKIKEVCEDTSVCKELPQRITTENNGDFYIPMDNPPFTLNINYTNGVITKK